MAWTRVLVEEIEVDEIELNFYVKINGTSV